MAIRAVLFDLGNTLMYAKTPELWPDVIRRGNQALIKYLSELGYLDQQDEFLQEFNNRLHQYYLQRDDQFLETSTFLVLKELLAEKGYPNISDQIIRESLDAHYAITQKNWELEKDTKSCLESLKRSNYKMGILSNAGDDRDVHQLIRKFNLRRYFDFVLTSAACGFRKPHEKIFEIAIENLMVKAEEVAMVGDTLNADILGANRLGIFSIWITRRVNPYPSGRLPTKPKATINILSELPSLLDNN